MGNCLVTKLKGVVDNDNLVKLGELKLHVLSYSGEAAGYKNSITLHFTEATRVYIKNGTFTVGDGVTPLTEYNCTAHIDFTFVMPNMDTYFFIENKYAIWTMGINKYFEADVYDFKYLSSLNEINLQIDGHISGDIAAFKDNQTITRLNLDKSQVYGDISVLRTMTLLTVFNLGNIAGVYGNLSSLEGKAFNGVVLAGCTNVQGSILSFAQNLVSCSYYMYSMPNVTGAIEDLAAALVANGGRSITHTFMIGGSGITYEGQPISTISINIDANGAITYSV